MSSEYPCIYFEKDGKCRKFSDNTAISYCVMGPCSEQKLSNADRIRAMSDEELAIWLCRIMDCSICESNIQKDGECDNYSADGLSKPVLNWLQRPVEEDT